jgi:hypothetical protein
VTRFLPAGASSRDHPNTVKTVRLIDRATDLNELIRQLPGGGGNDIAAGVLEGPDMVGLAWRMFVVPAGAIQERWTSSPAKAMSVMRNSETAGGVHAATPARPSAKTNE